MNVWTARLSDWWRGLSDRERWMVGGLGALVAALAFWYGLMAPLNRLAAAAEARQIEATTALRQVQALSEAVSRIEQMRGDGRSGPVDDHVRRAANAAGVTIAREQAEAGGGVSVWTEPLPAKALFAWLSALEREYGVGVSALEAHRAEEPGMLDVRAAFAGAAR
jgi:general secretion pathway protein M